MDQFRLMNYNSDISITLLLYLIFVNVLNLFIIVIIIEYITIRFNIHMMIHYNALVRLK